MEDLMLLSRSYGGVILDAYAFIDVSFTKIAIQLEWALIAFMRFYYTLFTIEFHFLLLDFLYIG